MALVLDGTTGITSADNSKIKLGDGNDLQIYHSGADSYITDAGTGALVIKTNELKIQNAAGTQEGMYFVEGGAATLSHNNVARISTTATGIDVTGNIVASGTVDGVDIAARDAVLTSTATTAGAALPLAGGAMTGPITTNSTFDGVDIAVRDAVLTSTTTTANAALPKAGGAMTGAITTNSTFDGVDIATRDAVLTATTTTANAALPLAGGTMTGNLVLTNNSTGIHSKDTSGVASRILTMDNGDTLIIGNPTTVDDIRFDVDTYGEGAMFIKSNGNVGIGTNTPATTLNVKSSSYPYVRITNDGYTGLDIGQADSSEGGAALIKLRDAADMDFYTADTNRMRISSTGNVGIGTLTTDPNATLEVSGGTGMTGGWGRTMVLRHAFPVLVFQSEYSTDAFSGIGYDNSTGLKFFVNTPTIDITASGAVPALTILDSHNVGIGTTPEATIKLDVSSGAITNPARFRFADDNNGASNNILAHEYFAGIEIENTYSGAAPSANGTKIAKLTFTTVTAGGYGAGATIHTEATSNGYDSGELVLSTGSNSASRHTERMRIGRTGNVGIGITTPDRLLHLQKTRGTISSGSSDAGAVVKLHLTAQFEAGYNSSATDFLGGLEFSSDDTSGSGLAGAGVRAAIRAPVLDAYNNVGLSFETGGTKAERMRIDSAGRVGIGTPAPATPLHVRHVGNPNSGGNRSTVETVLTLDGTGHYPYAGYGVGIDFKGEDYGNTAIREYAKIEAVMLSSSAQNAAGDPSFTSGLTFWTNSGGASGTLATEKMRIHATGLVTTPYQSSFRAYTTTDYTTNQTMEGSPGVWAEQHDNINDFSNGRFTAPVDGVYMFTVMWDSNSSQGGLSLLVNTATYYVRWEPTGVTGDAWESKGWSTTIKLSSGDYVRLVGVHASGSNPFHMGGGHWGFFSGHLLG